MQFLSDADVERVLTPAAALAAVRRAFAAFGTGRAAAQRRERTAVDGVKLSTLGAVLVDDGVLGAKVYATIGDRFTFLVVLFAAEDGRRLAVMESDALTRLRTAATSVLSTELLAALPPRHLTVFGAGSQAIGHLMAFGDRFALDAVSLVTRSPRPEVADVLGQQLGVAVEPVGIEQAAAALGKADVVVTATRSTTPLFDGRDLRASAHVCAVGSSRLDTRELDDKTFERASRVAVEWRRQARGEAGGVADAVDAGILSWDDVLELGELTGGRLLPSAGGISVFQSVGIGLEDVAAAAAAWRVADAEGAGTLLE